MQTDQRLYRATAFEPALGYDDVAFLIDQGGPVTKYNTAFYGVQGVRPAGGFGPHGLFLIWTQGAAPAGYSPLPQGIPTGNIAAFPGQVTFQAPAGLQLGNYQLIQVRFAMEVLALTGAVSLHDLDVLQSVGTAADFGIATIQGHLNMQDQFQSPADQTVDPAQNANKALPAAFPFAHPRDIANLTETFWFENNPPSWTVVNNGGAAITGGSVGLRFWGFRYSLIPLVDPGDSSWGTRWIAGAYRRAPLGQRIVAIPVVPPTGTSTF